MKYLKMAYDWWLEFWGRPGFYYTNQLRYLAKKRPWLFLVVGVPIFVVWLIKLCTSRNKWGWALFGVLIMIFTTWLLIHLGGFGYW